MHDININSTYGVIIIQDFKVVYADNNYAKMFGYQTAENLLNCIDFFDELLSPESHELVRKNYIKTIAGEMKPRGKTFTNKNRQGEEFTVFSVDHVIEWEGKPALQVTTIDLSIMLDANKKIREKDLMFKRLIMNSGQGILIHRNFKPLMINQAWVDAMHGESIEQAMMVNSILQFIPIEKQNESKEHYQKLMDGISDSKSNIVENICFDGKKRFFNIYDSLIEWEGEPAMQVVLEDFTDKVEFEKALAYRASHDQLTDLYNRSAVYDWLDEHLKSSDDIFCILMDIDDFKKVNDTHGHQVGDQVIQSLSNIIKNTVKEVDGVAGRWGGEEFIIFLPKTSLTKVAFIAESIRSNFNKVQYQPSIKEAFHASVSIGISGHNGANEMIGIDELIKQADKYLYLAKAKGKNCAVTAQEKF